MITIELQETDLNLLRQRLLSQARLFENPPAYAAGVEDTLQALRALMVDGEIHLPEPVEAQSGRML